MQKNGTITKCSKNFPCAALWSSSRPTNPSRIVGTPIFSRFWEVSVFAGFIYSVKVNRSSSPALKVTCVFAFFVVEGSNGCCQSVRRIRRILCCWIANELSRHEVKFLHFLYLPVSCVSFLRCWFGRFTSHDTSDLLRTQILFGSAVFGCFRNFMIYDPN